MKRLYLFAGIFVLEIIYLIFICCLMRTVCTLAFFLYLANFVALLILFLLYRNFKLRGKIIAGIIVSVLTLSCGFVFTINEMATSNLFFHYSYSEIQKENETNPSYDKVKYGSCSGWLYAPYSMEDHKLIVYFGEYYEPAESSICHSSKLNGAGIEANLLCMNYPGYGSSHQLQNKKNFYKVADKSVDYAINELGVRPENILILGYGYGTVFALEAASARDVGALVLFSPVENYENLAKSNLNAFERCFVFKTFGTTLSAWMVEKPTYIITSEADIYYNEEQVNEFNDRFENSTLYVADNVEHFEYWFSNEVLSDLNEIVQTSFVEEE